MGRKTDLAKNTLIFSIGTVLPKISVFITLPALTGCLTKEEYGTFDLVFVIMPLFLPILTLNIRSAAFRFLIDARNDAGKIQNIVSNTLIFSFAVSAVSLPVIFFLLPGSFMVRLLTCIYMPISLTNATMRMFSRGLGRNFDYSVSVVADSLFKVIFIIIFLRVFNMGLNGAILAVLAASASAGLFIFFNAKIYRYVSLSTFSISEIKELIAYSCPAIFNSLSWWIINTSDRLIISSFIGLAANAVYAVARKFPALLNIAQSTFSMAWTENASLAIKDKDSSAYYSSMFRIIIDLMGGLLGLIICFTPILFSVLIRGDYSDAYNQMPILFAAAFFHCLSGFLGGIYTACKNMKRVAVTTMEAAFCNLVIDLALIKFVGLYAASISTLISYIAVVIIRMRDAQKMVGIKYDYKHIALVLTVMTVETVLCFFRNAILDVVNAIIGLTFFAAFNKNLMLNVKKKVSAKIKRNKQKASPAI